MKKILGEKKKIDKTAMKHIVASLPNYQLNILAVEYATISGRQIEQDIEVCSLIALKKRKLFKFSYLIYDYSINIFKSFLFFSKLFNF